MAAPEGYTELGRIGFVDKGNYASGTTYRTGDVVYYNGSTWVALKDNLRGVTPAPGANWKYMARGFAAEALSAITAVDTSGVLREAGASVTSQELIDAIADKVMTKLIEKSKIVNNLLATDATTVLSGPMGKSLDDKITQLNSDLANEAVGYTAATTLYTADLANASGTIKIMVRNAIITIEIVSLTCTPDTPIYDISGYVGSNKYFYDTDNTGLYIDKSQLYCKKAGLGHVMWTFVIR